MDRKFKDLPEELDIIFKKKLLRLTLENKNLEILKAFILEIIKF